MHRVSPNRVVDAVLRGREAKSSDDQLQQQLVELGVPISDTRSTIECVEHGFKAGVTAVVTGGASATGIALGDNPVFDAAFRRGKAAMRFASPGWALLKLVGPWLLLALLIGVVVYIGGNWSRHG